MTWPPAGHDRQRELFDDDAEPCEPPRAGPEPEPSVGETLGDALREHAAVEHVDTVPDAVFVVVQGDEGDAAVQGIRDRIVAAGYEVETEGNSGERYRFFAVRPDQGDDTEASL